jgi:hypothetical protein
VGNDPDADIVRFDGTPTAPILDDSSRPVEVSYSLHDGNGNEGRFVLRQKDGVRRLDSTISDGAPATVGYFVILVPRGEPNQLYCAWNTTAESSSTYFVGCGTGTINAGGIDDIVDVLMSSGIAGEAEPRTIASRLASCYDFVEYAVGEVCLDNELGVPLLVDAQCRAFAPCLRIEATAVSEKPTAFAAPPIDLIPNAVAGGSDGEGRFDVTLLGLPQQFTERP